MASTQIHIGPADHGRKMTLGEFRDAEEEPGYRYELARGMLEVIEIPKTPHRRVVTNLFRLVAAYEREHPGLIDYFGGGTEVRTWKTGMDLARHPDFGIVFIGAPLDDEGDLQPYLVAEVVSASSKVRDYQEKCRDYLVYGVREYWIVDPLQRQVTVLTRRGEGADATWAERVLGDGELLESALLPGLATTVADLWARV
ncbi:MAG TPA: Uma2 family endonuclease [Isosphaeraceae bacterium]|nr:Uma2 family endonuclease [Isosphaeraceae bacterium]